MSSDRNADSCSSQVFISSPNTCMILPLDRTGLAGRLAGNGYWVEAMAFTVAQSFDLDDRALAIEMIAFASSKRDVWPAADR